MADYSYFFSHDGVDIPELVSKTIQAFYQQKDDDQLTLKEVETMFKSLDGSPVGDLEQYLQYLNQHILPYSTHLASPTFIGHMTSRLPDFVVQITPLVVALNQNLIKTETSKGLTFQEKQVIAKMHRLLYGAEDDFYQQYSQDHSSSLGFFTSGGTLSNITAIYTALNASADCTGSRLKYWLQRGYQDVVIIGSELLHYSFDKAADLLGVSLLKCPVNSQYQIDLLKLNQLIQECHVTNKRIIALIGVVGTTDFGSIDDLIILSEIAQQEKIHFHVDAAWGGGFVFHHDYKTQFLAGIENADTVTLDGHKQLMLPMGCGMLFFKVPELARRNMHHAPYAVREDSLDIGRFTLEGSRLANGLYLEAALRVLGQVGYTEILQHSLNNTRYMAGQIQASEAFELIINPVMNLLLYRYIPEKYRGKPFTKADNEAINQANLLLQQGQKERGKTFVSRTMRITHLYPHQKLLLLRCVLFNPLTQQEHIDEVLQDQIMLAKSLKI